jgi:dienelactone hydrolase
MVATAMALSNAALADEAESQPLGNAMIREYLAQQTAKIEGELAEDFASREMWEQRRPKYMEEYLYMLGLSPLPERTPLHATVTRSLAKGDYVVDMIHFQSRPRLYVTGNLYRPAKKEPNERLPAVLYLCGHANMERDGNKTAYQSHGIWFARHGYVCLVLDTLQLGEIAAYHHGTYKLGRWWWHSRGYTPAGVEAWNGMRAIDYLAHRDDVDPQRIAVTGISGGGAATFWIAAADDRVKVAVPVSGMSDLHAYVDEELIDKHCDCMFLYNSFRWPWTRIAALVAPRPMLFINSDHDLIFPQPANERIAARLENCYKLYGAGDRFDSVTSIGGHDYREDIRKAAFRFINTYLKDDPRPITDSEGGERQIPGEELRVFRADNDLPRDELNTTIDLHFVPMARCELPSNGSFKEWQRDLLERLRAASFSYFPNDIPAAQKLGEADGTSRMRSEDSIEFRLRSKATASGGGNESKKVLLAVLNADEAEIMPDWVSRVARADEALVYCEPRGIGATRWTAKPGGNAHYVERAHALLGRTVDTGRVWDIIAAAKYLKQQGNTEVRVAGRGSAGVLAAYAGALDEGIDGVAAVAPFATHMDAAAPQFLNVLRVCDVPEVFGLMAPRPVQLLDVERRSFERTETLYKRAEAGKRISFD